jgi:hypothetical protein
MTAGYHRLLQMTRSDRLHRGLRSPRVIGRTDLLFAHAVGKNNVLSVVVVVVVYGIIAIVRNDVVSLLCKKGTNNELWNKQTEIPTHTLVVAIARTIDLGTRNDRSQFDRPAARSRFSAPRDCA